MGYDDAYIATTRFGFGARPGELDALEKGAKRWLIEQLNTPVKPDISFTDLPSTGEIIRTYTAYGREADARRDARQWAVELNRKEVEARTLRAITTDQPFVERLVHFWSNHFAVSAQKNAQMPALVGAMEREAIRPHVLGSFSDMLLAVTQHPAMLIYLDNIRSIGPNSRAGGSGRGLNENLAREILELHTLGVNGGYTQEDVQELAKIITGWTVEREPEGDSGFRFEPNWHETGKKRLLTLSVHNDGEREGIRALEFLARHNSTAEFLSRKLIRHFITETPEPSMVNHVAGVYRYSGGNLRQVAQALLEIPETWKLARTMKIKNPSEFTISAARLTQSTDVASVEHVMNGMKTLAHYPFMVNSPAGYSDDSVDWTGPDAMMRRVDWARQAGRKFNISVTADELARHAMYPVLSDATYQTVQLTKNQGKALGLLFASPEFQKR